jgi:hypothetical protein
MNTPQDPDALLDTALDNYPMAPLPAGFVQATMARLIPPVRFHLHFLDLAVPLVFSLLLLALFAVFFWLRGTLTWLPLPPPNQLTAATIAGFSWPAILLVVVLGEVALLLAGLASFEGVTSET